MTVARLLERAGEQTFSRIIVDLNTPGLDPSQLVPQLRALSSPPQQIIAFGPHVHEARLAAAKESGCDLVLTRGQFYARAEELLSESRLA